MGKRRAVDDTQQSGAWPSRLYCLPWRFSGRAGSGSAGQQTMPVPSPARSYDYIIIGAGSSGCAPAPALSGATLPARAGASPARGTDTEPGTTADTAAAESGISGFAATGATPPRLRVLESAIISSVGCPSK